MGFYVLRRLFWGVALFFILTLVIFSLFFVLPSDPTRIGRGSSTADTVDIRDAYQLDGPLLKEYGEFTWRIIGDGDLGRSIFSGQPVSHIMMRAAPVTASLVVGGAVLWLLIALPIGIVSALRPRSLIDRTTTVFVVLGISAHPVWIGYLLSYTFGHNLGWFPFTGYCDFFDPAPGARCGGPARWAYSLVLPWTTFALLFAALYSRMIRASVLETMSEEYVRTARAKGLPERVVLRAHVLRNALLGIVTMIGMDMGVAFGGAVFVETVFGLPGLGQLAIPALQRRDMPVLIGLLFCVTTAIIVLNLIVDLVYSRLDPRIEIGRASLGVPPSRGRRRLDAANPASVPSPEGA